MSRLTTRLAAAGLAVALPLAAVAGCGIEKRRTIKAELRSAGDHLQSSQALSMTLRMGDPAGSLLKLATQAGGTSAKLAPALLGGSVTYVIDPAGNATLKDLGAAGAGHTPLKDELKRVNFALVVRDSTTTLGELRMVAGSLYLQVNLQEISRLARLGGQADFDQQLDDNVGSDPNVRQLLTDVRAGKWISVPLSDYLDKLQGLAKSFSEGLANAQPEPKAAPHPAIDYSALGQRIFTAVKPFVKVTDANNSAADRVLDVSVSVRPALKAALAVIKASKDLPFAGALDSVTFGAIDQNVSDGLARGTISLKNGHLTSVGIDLESLRLLDPTPGTDSLKGASVQLDVNDNAAPVVPPDNLSAFDLGKVLSDFLDGLNQKPGLGFTATSPLLSSQRG